MAGGQSSGRKIAWKVGLWEENPLAGRQKGGT